MQPTLIRIIAAHADVGAWTKASRISGHIDHRLEVLCKLYIVGRVEDIIERWIVGVCSGQNTCMGNGICVCKSPMQRWPVGRRGCHQDQLRPVYTLIDLLQGVHIRQIWERLRGLVENVQ